MFHVGQKVVCVRPHHKHQYQRRVTKVPVVGATYKVRGFDDSGGVLLEEVVNPLSEVEDIDAGKISFGEPSFYPDRFRPLIERKTDISALRALLNPANHKYLERA